MKPFFMLNKPREPEMIFSSSQALAAYIAPPTGNPNGPFERLVRSLDSLKAGDWIQLDQGMTVRRLETTPKAIAAEGHRIVA